MRAFSQGLLAAAVLILVAAEAHAQRGGRGFGQLGGGSLMLLNQKSVQQELRLSDQQTKKVDGLIDEQRSAFAELRDLDQQERREKLAERLKAQDTAIAGLLDTDQAKRLKQITWQQRGGGALGESEVAEALGLSSEQKDQLMTLQRGAASEMRNLFQGGGDREESRKKLQEARAAANEKALGLLTSEQKEKWKALLGEPFTGEIAPPMQRGRPGGAERPSGRRPIQASTSRNFYHLASFAPEVGTDDTAAAKPADDKAPKAQDGGKQGRHARHATHGARGHRGAHAMQYRRARWHHGPWGQASPARFARHGRWGHSRDAARGPHPGFHGDWQRYAHARWRQYEPNPAWYYRHHEPRGRYDAWQGPHAGPGYADDGPGNVRWHDGPRHHMASWHGGPPRHPAGTPRFRGPHGPQGDGPRDFGPEHRRPEGPRRGGTSSSAAPRDVESQLTQLERQLDEISRQLAQALEQTRH
jgi:hypothetical protein